MKSFAIYPAMGVLAMVAAAQWQVIRAQAPEAGPDIPAGLRKDGDGLEEIIEEDGAVTIHLENRFQSATVARITPEGELETRCFTGPQGMHEFMAGNPDPEAEEVVK